MRPARRGARPGAVGVAREGALCRTCTPGLIGQPFRVGCLEDALGYIVRHAGVWSAPGSAIVDWYGRARKAGC